MKAAAEAGHQTPEELVKQIHDLMDEAEALLVGPATGRMGDRLGEIRSRLKNAQVRLGEIYADARDKVVDGAKHADKAIRSHPYESLAIALGVGVLLGVCIRRGNS